MKTKQFSKVCVMGLGYIGLPTAAMFASRGVDVIGIDVKPDVVETINRGEIHIVEPELDILVRAATQTGKLRASLTPEPADAFIIAVPTPFFKDSGAVPKPCIDFVLAAAKAIAPFVQEGNLIIVESTSPVGTTQKVAELLTEQGVDTSKIHLAYCPERVLPGKVITELVENDRVVGGINPESAARAKALYQIFVQGEIFETQCKVSEMVKLTENAYRDVNIAFANELSIICDGMGIDVSEVIKIASCHPRVKILSPGCGVGGHCIAVDPWFIVDSDPENARIIRTAREVNDYKSLWVMERIKSEYRKLDKAKPVVALCGLAFKPDIDDLRASPALKIAKTLGAEQDAEFLFVEPNIETHPDLAISEWQQALAKADLIVKLVAHAEFAEPEFVNVQKPVLDFSTH